MPSLIDRYVAAAADDFPGSDNAATAREVRAAVEDIVEARLAAGMSQGEAERAAVEELGDPQLFAEQFRQEPRYLIGPRVFRSWWLAIRIALSVVVPLFIALGVIEYAATGDGSVAGFLGEAIGGAFEGLLQSVFWVTITFAIIEYSGRSGDLADDSDAAWTADDLPKINMGRQVTISEVILSLVALIGASYLAVRFRADDLGAFGLNQLYDLDASIPVFNPELSSWWGIAFFALLVISLAVSVWSFIRGYWTRNVLFVKLMDSGLWIAFVLLLGNAGDIINPRIVENSGSDGDWWITGENSNSIIITIALVIIFWDIFETLKGHLDYRKLMAQQTR